MDPPLPTFKRSERNNVANDDITTESSLSSSPISSLNSSACINSTIENANENKNEMVEQLINMGFQRNQIIVALRNTNNNIERAVEYLANNNNYNNCNNDETMEEDIEMEIESINVNVSSKTSVEESKSSVPFCSSVVKHSSEDVDSSVYYNPPKNNDTEECKSLVDMGFLEKDVVAALQATNNNFEFALAMLLG